MLVAETAILFDFHPIRMCLALLGGVVVTLFAVLASQCDFGTQTGHFLPLFHG